MYQECNALPYLVFIGMAIFAAVVVAWIYATASFYIRLGGNWNKAGEGNACALRHAIEERLFTVARKAYEAAEWECREGHKVNATAHDCAERIKALRESLTEKTHE